MAVVNLSAITGICWKTSGEDYQQLSPLAIQEVNLICEDTDGEEEKKEEEEKILGNNKDNNDAQYSDGDRENKENAVELEPPRNNAKNITA